MTSIGQDPAKSDGAGTYLHVLWNTADPSNFWLYVGQAGKLSERMGNHNNQVRRRLFPSLHYHVMDSIPEAQLGSVFVTLSTNGFPEDIAGQLILNLQEMWMCLVFQTLTSRRLEEYLPEGSSPLWVGSHLNVALPLWQGFTGNSQVEEDMKDAIGGREVFQQYLWTTDPSLRQWAENARDAFNDLRNSPDPILRKYYDDLHSRKMLHARQAWDRKKAESYKGFLSERKMTARSANGLYLVLGSFHVGIPRSLGFTEGDEVFLQVHLTETRHPNAYTQKALPQDPASRLGISIRGHRGDFHSWLTTKGVKIVKKINSFVDVLEGYSLESLSFERRWAVKRRISGDITSRQTMYT